MGTSGGGRARTVGLVLAIVFGGSAAPVRATPPLLAAAGAMSLAAAEGPEGYRLGLLATPIDVNDENFFIAHPATDGVWSRILLLTRVETLHGHPTSPGDGTVVAVRYNLPFGEWLIERVDGSDAVAGEAYNILVASGIGALVHGTFAGNVLADSTLLDHPMANGNRGAAVFALHNQRPVGSSGFQSHPSALGVRYADAGTLGERWAIYNESGLTMEYDLEFNVLVVPPGPNVFLHTATVANTSFDATVLSHPQLDENPHAWILVSHVHNPPTGPAMTLDTTVSVNYSPATRRWAIRHDGGTMPIGAAFNVLVAESVPLFADDFDSGTTNWWSASAP